MSAGDIKPGFRLGRDRRLEGERFQQGFAFRRHWPAIIFLLVFDLVIMVPAILTGREAIELWSAPGDLFSLVAALFTTFWLLGWSTGPLVMTAILLVMVFGREMVRVRPGVVQVSLGLPLISLQVQYQAAAMCNLRLDHPAPKTGKSWRGPHVAFDYGGNSGEFGSALSQQDFEQLKAKIETAAGTLFGEGEPLQETDSSVRRAPGMAALSAIASQIAPRAGPGPSASSEPTTEQAPGLRSPSVLALVVANFAVLAGAIFYGWDLGMVMLLYWAESAIIGVFNLCKIVVIGRWAALMAGPFFAGHFGGFMAVHFLFLYTLFIKGPADFSGGTDLAEVAALFAGLWPALAILFFSHAFSFFRNFLGRKEYLGRTVGYQMHEPYSRIIFMHLVLIFGGGLVLVLGDSQPVLLAVIVLKTAVDVRSHLRERKAAST